jgi:viologen exporter family transport system permease protein
MLATGLSSVLFNYNVAFISRRIGRGQLDHTLIQPQPIWLALLTEGFAPFSAVMELVPGLALLVWALGRVGVQPSPGWVALLVLNLAASAAVALAYAFMWGSLAFWAPRAAEEINSSTWRLLDVLKPFPLDGLGGGLVAGLLSIVPVGLLAWYPCRALLGLNPSALGPFGTPLAALVFLLVMVWLFRRGMRHYGYTGSQRYLSWGHRR